MSPRGAVAMLCHAPRARILCQKHYAGDMRARRRERMSKSFQSRRHHRHRRWPCRRCRHHRRSPPSSSCRHRGRRHHAIAPARVTDLHRGARAPARPLRRAGPVPIGHRNRGRKNSAMPAGRSARAMRFASQVSWGFLGLRGPPGASWRGSWRLLGLPGASWGETRWGLQGTPGASWGSLGCPETSWGFLGPPLKLPGSSCASSTRAEMPAQPLRRAGEFPSVTAVAAASAGRCDLFPVVPALFLMLWEGGWELACHA